MSDKFHTSVLLKEVKDFLQVQKDKKYIDATLGGGGHTAEIVKRGGIILGIDVDEDAIRYVRKKFKSQNSKVKIVKGNFRELGKIALSNNFGRIAGIIFDLGVSSYQINKGERGFSFQKEGPLDMRMDKNQKLKASDILNLATKDELYNIFAKFGEERRAGAISDAILRARSLKAFESSDDLLKVLKGVYKISGEVPDYVLAGIAKRTFQALRIAVNDELRNLEDVLPKAQDLLEEGGRLLVISFHSLEDRIVKEKFLQFESSGKGKIITKKPVIPNAGEIKLNPRARSAKLRVFEKRYVQINN